MRLVFDIEADGLLDTITKVHCIVVRDLDTGEVFEFYNYLKDDTPPARDRCYGGLVAGSELLSGATELWGHNIQGYDLPALKKILGWEPKATTVIRDTLVMTRLARPDIAAEDRKLRPDMPGGKDGLIGRHSLDAWGYRLGERKAAYDGGWETLTQEMLDYCVQDVEVNVKLVEWLETQGLTPESVELEHAFSLAINRMMSNGMAFDVEAGEALAQELCERSAEIEDELLQIHDGWTDVYFTPKRKERKEKWVPFNPNSRAHVARLLKERHGWKPSVFTKSGEPKLDEEVLGALPYPEAALLAERFIVTKILGRLYKGKNTKAWLEAVQGDGRLYPFVNHNGARTGRCTHKLIVNVPSRGKYGERVRALFIAGPGNVLVGVDAAGLEMRTLAHYVGHYDGGALAAQVLEGDVHQANFEALSKFAPGITSRDKAKAPLYAALYGAGPAKMGKLGGGPIGLGKRILRALYEVTPGLEKLTKAAKAAFKANGYLRGLDGRKLEPYGDHSALNTLNQGAGALVMKQATVFLDLHLDGLEARLVTFQHDEWQLECPVHRVAEVAEVAKDCIRRAGEHFGLRIALAGDAKIGKTWADTH